MKSISSDVVVPQDTTIDHSVTIAAGVLLSDRLVIEADAVIEPGVVFANGGAKPIQVRSGVRIGAGAVIGPEVELGWGVHVKPGSVVLASVPANENICFEYTRDRFQANLPPHMASIEKEEHP